MRPVALRTVRLHVAARLAREPAQSRQQFIRAGGNEARGDHRQDQAALVARHRANIADECTSLGLGDERGGVPIEGRTLRGIIHRHAADERALQPCKADIGERLRSRQMNGSKVHRRGRAVRQQSVDQGFVRAARIREVLIACLEGKRISLQPFLEWQVERQSELRPLGRMHMKIDETRQQVLAFLESHQGASLAMARRHDRRPRRVLAIERLDLPGAAHLDQHGREKLDPAARRRVQRVAEKCSRRRRCRSHCVRQI